MRTVHALCVHGVGDKTPSNFAHKAMTRLSGALQKRGVQLYSQSVHWGPLLDAHQEKMARLVRAEGSDNRMLQRAGMSIGGDALSYRYSQDAINHLFDYEYLRLRSDEVVVFAHSLGCVLATDWLRSRDKARISRMVTMGCNLEAFNQGNEAAWLQSCPKQLSKPGTWENVFDPEDMLGWPVKHWLPQVRDHRVEVGGFFTGWWGASHIGYWNDKNLWTSTMPDIILGP